MPCQCTICTMSNLASVLKAEVARIARKELRGAADGLNKASAKQRSEIAGLKRRVQELEKQLKALSRAAVRVGAVKASAGGSTDGANGAGGLRFRAAGMASNRKRLGLSAEDFGLLVGASGQSVYSWERGTSKPRAKHLSAIAALRGIGKREVATRLEALKTTS